ncbi:hypothetical protein NKH77_38295 [Streptomyces sp. M19]
MNRWTEWPSWEALSSVGVHRVRRLVDLCGYGIGGALLLWTSWHGGARPTGRGP